MNKIPKKYETIVFVFFMVLLMACIMSGVITAFNLGTGPGYFSAWRKSFLLAFSVAFPTALLVVPIVRKYIVGKIVAK